MGIIGDTTTIKGIVINALVIELVMALIVPLVGFLVDVIIVRGIRRIIARRTGNSFEFVFSNYVLFVGTVIHEMSHALFALISGARLEEVALFAPDGQSLGHVVYRPRGDGFMQAFQCCIASCAPVVTGVLLTLLMFKKVFPSLSAAWQFVIAIYVQVSLVFHMNMSPADLKSYFRGVPMMMLFMLPVVIVILIFK